MPPRCIGMTVGRLRHLTDQEKETFPDMHYCVQDEHVFRFEHGDVTVPVGFMADGASGWRDVGHSWVLHDYLYRHQTLPRQEADQMMLAVLRYERNWAYYWGLKLALWLFKRRFNAAYNSHSNSNDKQ